MFLGSTHETVPLRFGFDSQCLVFQGVLTPLLLTQAPGVSIPICTQLCSCPLVTKAGVIT